MRCPFCGGSAEFVDDPQGEIIGGSWLCNACGSYKEGSEEWTDGSDAPKDPER